MGKTNKENFLYLEVSALKVNKKVRNTVKLGDKEQIGAKEPFPVTNCQFTSQG